MEEKKRIFAAATLYKCGERIRAAEEKLGTWCCNPIQVRVLMTLIPFFRSSCKLQPYISAGEQ